MPIRSCPVVAIEGTQASGKTTLMHGLMSRLGEAGIVVACVDEPARSSPYIEEIVLHQQGDFDLATEVDLFGAQLSAQLRAARNSQLLICDKTVLNVLAYASELLRDTDPDAASSELLQTMRSFGYAWAKATYDLVLYCTDHFDDAHDALRGKVQGRQAVMSDSVRRECEEAGLELIDVPFGLSASERVAYCEARIIALVH